MDDSHYYKKAKKKVEEKKKFHNHLQSYIIVNLIMVFMGRFFRGWITVAFFWGIGLFFHFIKAYGYLGEGSNWEEKEIEKEVKRMRAREKYRGDRNPPHNKYSHPDNDLNMDEYLDLNQPNPTPQKKYDEEDLV
jgi:hypothetical protein